MFESAFVTLRECSECLLILWLLRVWTANAYPGSSTAPVHAGAALGVGLGIAATAILFFWVAWGPQVAAWVNVLLGLGVLGLGCTALGSRADISRHVADRVVEPSRRGGWKLSVAAFATLAALRETAELCVFLHQFALEHGLQQTLTGVALGVATVVLGVQAFHRVRSRVALLVVFHLSSLLLCLLAIKLALAGASSLLTAAGQPPLVRVAQQLLPGEPLFGYLCLALMVPPTLILARRWWRRAGG